MFAALYQQHVLLSNISYFVHIGAICDGVARLCHTHSHPHPGIPLLFTWRNALPRYCAAPEPRHYHPMVEADETCSGDAGTRSADIEHGHDNTRRYTHDGPAWCAVMRSPMKP